MKKTAQRIEFGDFQTPDNLAMALCKRLSNMDIQPDVVIEPTCGTGAFVLAAAKAFPEAREILGIDINAEYLAALRRKLTALPGASVTLEHANFFEIDWRDKLARLSGSLLVIGNFPWVTNATQGAIGGKNLPQKSNFQSHRGLDAITGKANFDISEWMLLEVLDWFQDRSGAIAMLCKTSVARKVLAHIERRGRMAVEDAFLVGIDAKENFDAAVDACLLVIRLAAIRREVSYDYIVYRDLQDFRGKRVGHRMGLAVGDLDAFASTSFLLGQSPQKWRSGIKHDASGVMEFRHTDLGLTNGLGEVANLESTYIYPLMKGSDVASARPEEGRELYVLVTQEYVGEPTERIRELAPATWSYLLGHSRILDGRKSSIYANQPRFSIFGVGDYAFRPWRIAICGLYKVLRFRLVPPRNGRPVMFDDTVYYLSFDSEDQAYQTLERLNSKPAVQLLSSLIFWDEKRPIKTSILNTIDWSRLKAVPLS